MTATMVMWVRAAPRYTAPPRKVIYPGKEHPLHVTAYRVTPHYQSRFTKELPAAGPSHCSPALVPGRIPWRIAPRPLPLLGARS